MIYIEVNKSFRYDKERILFFSLKLVIFAYF